MMHSTVVDTMPAENLLKAAKLQSNGSFEETSSRELWKILVWLFLVAGRRLIDWNLWLDKKCSFIGGNLAKLCDLDETESLAALSTPLMHFFLAVTSFLRQSALVTTAYQQIRKTLSLISKKNTDFCSSTSHNEFSLQTELVFEVREVKITFRDSKSRQIGNKLTDYLAFAYTTSN